MTSCSLLDQTKTKGWHSVPPDITQKDGIELVAKQTAHHEDKREGKKLTIQVIRRHQQLQAQLGRHVDIGHVFGVLVLFVVVKVLADFLEHEAAICC